MDQTEAPTTASLREAAKTSSSVDLALGSVVPGFGNRQSYELMVRQATMLATSSLVPTEYRAQIIRKHYDGSIKSCVDNPNAIPNCSIAINMAIRLDADPVMVCQNLNVIEGRPSWSAQWITAEINNSPKFKGLLKYDTKILGKKTVTYTETIWEAGTKHVVEKSIEIENMSCRAYAIERETGERINGVAVTIETAVKEGWFTKAGSKWQTIPEVMIENRAASWFGKKYIPERLVGLPSSEELHDIMNTIDVLPQEDGSHAADLNSLRKAADQDRAGRTDPAPDKNADAQEVKVNETPSTTATEVGALVDEAVVAGNSATNIAGTESGPPFELDKTGPDSGDTPIAAGVQNSDDLDICLKMIGAGQYDDAMDLSRSLSEAEKARFDEAFNKASIDGIDSTVKTTKEDKPTPVASPVAATAPKSEKAVPRTRQNRSLDL